MVKLYDFWSSLAKSKRPDSKSYENVKKGIDDPMTVAKLHFFLYVAGLLQPFLTAFHGDGPMLPFLCNDIKTIFVSLLWLILKPQVFEKTQTSELTKVAEDDINLMKTKCIHLGFAAETEIQNLLRSKKVTAEQMLQMRGEALDFIRTAISKLSQCNPMLSAIVRSAEALDPQIMVNRVPEELKRKVRNLIQKIVNLKIVPFKTGDEALTEFPKFLHDEVTNSRDKFLAFKRADRCLDDFYFEETYPSFAAILKIVFTMSHGQASVERGFNDNNVVLKDNMGDLTVVARRFIKNYLRINKVKPYTIQISSELLKSVKSARHRYEIHLEEQKKSAQKEQKNVELVEVENELQTMTSQCSNLEETIATLNS